MHGWAGVDEGRQPTAGQRITRDLDTVVFRRRFDFSETSDKGVCETEAKDGRIETCSNDEGTAWIYVHQHLIDEGRDHAISTRELNEGVIPSCFCVFR